MHNSQVRSEIVINAPINKVWDFLTNPHKIPLAMPGLIENTNVPDLPLQVGSKFNYKYQMFGVLLEGELTVTKYDKPTRYEFSTTGDAKSEWVYTLEDLGNSTKFVIQASYEVPQNVLQKLKNDVIAAMNQKESNLYVQNLKTLLEMQGE